MNLALFDFDSTITTRDMLPAFIHEAVTPLRLAFGKVLLAPMILGYRLGWVRGTVIRACIAWLGFRGVDAASVERAGQAFAQRVLPTVIRPEAMARIEWHRAQGDRVVVVSGSFDVYLSHWCHSHGLELICSALETRDGVLTGRYRGAQCVAVEKARQVLAQLDIAQYPVIYAYGDSAEDQAMLDLADHRIFRWRERGS